MSDTMQEQLPTSYSEPRRFAGLNYLGLWTLYKREVGRFIKVAMQTLFAPAVSTLLLMTVFKLAFGNRGELQGDFEGIAYQDFLAPGLVIMAILQNAFQNTSSSLTISKVQGTSVDFLMPPLSPLELTVGFIAGAATRGVMVGAITGIAIQLLGLADLSIVHFWALAWHALMASIILGAIGAMGGIWADKFDHLAAVTNFVIVPLTFLSGTFYDVKVLAEPFQTLAHWDPIFYLIDGFRFGFLGVANSNIGVGLAVTGGLALFTSFLVWLMFKSGYKLKA
ncbi:MAG: multidrug ABC transporter permease [Ponticaulis sp.]|nr:multidrug ABC transporter permease [Ponticaulis sp.]|tara:strand:- start:93553 stop:94392 length:840 start_codon:yes stop_codon:yes gene_type:complete